MRVVLDETLRGPGEIMTDDCLRATEEKPIEDEIWRPLAFTVRESLKAELDKNTAPQHDTSEPGR